MSSIIDFGDVTGREFILTIIPSSTPVQRLSSKIKQLNPDVVDAVMAERYSHKFNSHKPILSYEILEDRTGVRI